MGNLIRRKGPQERKRKEIRKIKVKWVKSMHAKWAEKAGSLYEE
jgi:hypothetical protein